MWPRLEKAGHSMMIEEEVVAGRLYTGPMYHKYNTVLRAKSGDASLVETCKRVRSLSDSSAGSHAISH